MTEENNKVEYESNNINYQAILDSTHDLEIVRNKFDKLIYVSPAFKRIFGYKPEDYLSGKIKSTNLFLKEDAEKIDQYFEKIKNRETLNDFEVKAITKDKNSIWLSISAQPIKDNSGEIIGMHSSLREITDRKKIENKLRESEEKYRELFNSVKEGVAVYEVIKDGKEFIIKDFNKSAEKIEGVKKEDVVNKDVLKVFPGANEFGIINVFKEVYKTGNPRLMQSSIYYKDKTPSWRENYVFKLSSGNIVAVYSDITEKKKFEEELRESYLMIERVINLLPIRIFWKDKNLNYLGCNELFAKDSGKNNPKELIGKDDFQMAWKEQAKAYREDDKKVMDSKESKINFEEPQTTPNGKIIWLRTSKVPLTNTNGDFIGVLGAYEDITDKKNTEKEIIEKSQELEKFNQFAVNREIKMIELKKEINELLNKLGEKPKYKIDNE